MIKLLTGAAQKINLKETLRYLGYGGSDLPRGEVESLLKECGEEALKAIQPSACYEEFPVNFNGEKIDLCFCKTESNSLKKAIAGCKKTVLFAATIGSGIDRLIAKYARVSPAKAAVIGAMGSAAVEDWCDEICARLKEIYGAIRPRFSCGYGDLPITLQRDIFAALSITKHLGITLSDGCFMTPVKSVTAIVGIE